ncbi:MAG TPA: GGDEF domain-containing protein [Candidatus Acidoferrum sp.]|nr:GGDEF domain-containing protein [Candidatus Acidoferrum sp.]
MTPSSGAPVPAPMRPNDAYFDLLIETLEGLEPVARAQFLQRFFQSLSHLDIPENQVVAVWEEVLARRVQLSERSDSLVSFQTALVDVLSATGRFRLPVVLEYEELKSLERNAVTDALTGLHNRRLFDETFDKELNRARRYAHPLSLVALDLHRFKEVNDKHGHPRGDDVLHAAAATLRKALRTSDSAFRTGGDEFALILPQTDSTQASALSRRIGVVFSELLRPLNLTISVSMDHGVATYPQDGEQRDQLIRIADERLYHFKHGSREEAATEQPAAAAKPTPSAPAPPIEPEAPTATAAPQVPPVTPTAEPASEPPVDVPRSPRAVTPSPLQSSRPSFPLASEESRIYAVPRKAERVSMSGTNAYAVLADQPVQRARVVDLGFGGVALDFPATESVPETLLAVLHVPILPPVRVSLKRLWTKQLSEDTVRVGCCFVS